MSVLDLQYSILENWAGGLGWYVVGRAVAAGAAELYLNSEGDVGCRTPVQSLGPWILAASVQESAKC